MVASGRNPRQSEIDDKYLVLRTMIDELSRFIEDIIRHSECLRRKDAEAASEGEIEVEMTVYSNDPRADYEDILSMMSHYVYHAAVDMIYSFAEGTLNSFNNGEKLEKENARLSKMERLIIALQQRTNTGDIMDLRDYWPEFDAFHKLRTELVHEWGRGNDNEQWIGDPQQYLRDNLDVVHAMLREIEKQVPIHPSRQ